MMKNRVSSQEPVFIDTWGWLSLGHHLDSYHFEVKQIFKKLRQNDVSIYTSDYILNELITLLFRRENFDEAISFVNGVLMASTIHHIQIERVTSDRFTLAWELRKQFKDKPRISFTDFTSMIIMKERKIQLVLTKDNHFNQPGMGFSTIP